MSTAQNLDRSIQERVREWLTGPYDERTKAEILKMSQGDPKLLRDAFYTNLAFGTGGLRGIMGAGTNRMNIYTVGRATQALANYILKQVKTGASVFIGFDSRHNSPLFAQEAARVLAANGIAVHLLDELRPTPFVSFGVRTLRCTAGIMITASHNPKEYNGYKVYWSDGGQVVPPHDIGIMAEAEAIHSEGQVKRTALTHPLIEKVSHALDLNYLDTIQHLQLYPEQNQKVGHSLKIVYTPLHGTGITLVPRALKKWGFTTIHFVQEQVVPDGDFPTVKFPNPEFKETLELGIRDLVKSQSDILIATDPDADRVGAVVMHKGKPEILNGNQMAAICAYAICQALTEQKKMPSKGAIVTTIVTTELLKAIAESFDQSCFEVLTGFKYIGEMIHLWETSKDPYHFLFGAEESYGYLYGTHSRDKDAVVSSCLIAQIALFMKIEGRTLVDLMNDIYHKYGVFKEKQLSLNFNPGKEGMDRIASLMEHLRKNPPKSIAGSAVEVIEDYETKVRLFLKTGKKETLTLPHSDVLLFRLADGSKLVIRPSGTEPKIKAYAAVKKKEFKSIPDAMAECDAHLDKLLNAAKEDLLK